MRAGRPHDFPPSLYCIAGLISNPEQMKIPALTGLIRRRILVNYRAAPRVVASILPAPFRPKLINGQAIAGICLIRLEAIRPKGFPHLIGLTSENAAHRIAVEWEGEAGQIREGVFIPRHDTSSALNALAGGRVFPGVHHHTAFTVSDHDGEISVRVDAENFDSPLVELHASETDTFPATSIFGSLSVSSQFFEAGCQGYSPRADSCTLDGIRLQVDDWRVSPLTVHQLRSAFFDDPARFPPGTIQFDHALLMRDVPHEWHTLPTHLTRA